jgi:diguanylate cyclase (GGDEF)-like protein
MSTFDDSPPGPRLSVTDLQAENLRLRQQLDDMLREARRNQDKLRRFDELERKVIAASSLHALVQVLLVEFKQLFELDAVSLALVDPHVEIARILGDGADALPVGLLLLPDARPLQQLYATGARAQLATRAVAHDFLFENINTALASVALLPLVLRGNIIGSLNLGSLDAARYVAGASADFLERLAALVAVCLDSALGTERIKRSGLIDGLTGVHNRRYFEQRCLEEVTAAQRSGQPLVCLMLDVDHFKKINDSCGHPAGDAVLRHVASLIKAQVRLSDVVARYGGEEFVALLPATTLESGMATAERIRQRLAAHALPVGEHELVRVTISIGAALLARASRTQPAATQMAELIARADQSLYQAKAGGRNRVVSDEAS